MGVKSVNDMQGGKDPPQLCDTDQTRRGQATRGEGEKKQKKGESRGRLKASQRAGNIRRQGLLAEGTLEPPREGEWFDDIKLLPNKGWAEEKGSIQLGIDAENQKESKGDRRRGQK